MSRTTKEQLELNSILDEINEKLQDDEFERTSSIYAQTRLGEALEAKSFNIYTEEIICNSLLQQYEEVEGITWDNEKREKILDLLIERSGGREMLVGSQYYLNSLTSYMERFNNAMEQAMLEIGSSKDEEYNIQRYTDAHILIIEQVNVVTLPDNIKENIKSVIKKQIELERDRMMLEQLQNLLSK